MTGQEALTVSELNARIKGLIESDPVLGSVCGRGEIGRAHVCTPVTCQSRMPSSA